MLETIQLLKDGIHIKGQTHVQDKRLRIDGLRGEEKVIVKGSDRAGERMIESKMKDVPKEQRDMIMDMIEKNPDFFQKIAVEIQEKIQGGQDQMTATMTVMQKYQDDLKKLAGK